MISAAVKWNINSLGANSGIGNYPYLILSWYASSQWDAETLIIAWNETQPARLAQKCPRNWILA